MKKLIFTFIVYLLAITANAQSDYSALYESVTQTKQYECSGKTKAELWHNLKRWVALTFNSYKFITDMEDEKSGEMILKVTLSPDYRPLKYWNLKFPTTIDIVVQDGKYTMFMQNGKYECVATERLNNVNRFTPSVMLDDMMAESEALKHITGYDGDTSIEHVFSEIKYYMRQMNQTPKYRKPKDEKKGKVDSLWKDYKDRYDIASSILSGYYSAVSNLRDGLESTMKR